MAETKQIPAVEMVRRIRDELARELAGKSEAEIIAFYRRAGDGARESAGRGRPSRPRMGAVTPLTSDGARLFETIDP
jgi:hypothetical protein